MSELRTNIVVTRTPEGAEVEVWLNGQPPTRPLKVQKADVPAVEAALKAVFPSFTMPPVHEDTGPWPVDGEKHPDAMEWEFWKMFERPSRS